MGKTPQRLKRRREFLYVARTGLKCAAPGLVLQVLDRRAMTNANASDQTYNRTVKPTNNRVGEPFKGDNIRVGFTVTRKVGGSVVRNRTRRRLRAAVETVMPSHAALGRDYVVIGRAKTNARPFADLVGDLETALHKLNAWREVTTATDSLGCDAKNGLDGGPKNDKELRNG